MSPLNKDLTLLVLQYFNEENLKEAARTLGHESGLYFDLKYFEDTVLEGKWDEAENYLLGFTKVMDNSFSIKIFFELRKQKYFEALEVNDHHKALEILLKDLKVFNKGNESLFKDLSYMLMVDNIRDVKPMYQDVNSARKNLILEIKEIIIQHPLLGEKLKFPIIHSQRLHHILNQSLKFQRLQNPNQEPNLSMDYSNSKPSTSAPRNSGKNMDWKPSMDARPNIDLDERGSNLILGNAKPCSIEESHDSSKNMFEIRTPSQCRFSKLPMHPEVKKILRLAYNNAGDSILALASNGIHLVWRWQCNVSNSDGKASAQVCPILWQPKDVPQFMINDLSNIKGENPVSCFALSKMDGYVISTSGGVISLFNMVTFKTLATLTSLPPMVTSISYYPKDNNIFGIGFDDSTILIYHARRDEVLFKLEGHSTRVTALAFSNSLNILVSGDANAQIILWNTNGWKKLKEKHLQIHGNRVPVPETQIQFHPNQLHFLIVHSSHLAIYKTIELRCVNQWVQEVPVLISQATFSSDGHTVYSIFVDGTVAIFGTSNFEIRCRVYPSCYLPSISSLGVYPITIAAHPQKSTQFAIGLSDGSVYVFEPRSQGGDWIKNQ